MLTALISQSCDLAAPSRHPCWSNSTTDIADTLPAGIYGTDGTDGTVDTDGTADTVDTISTVDTNGIVDTNSTEYCRY